jgi:hypothetical protein
MRCFLGVKILPVGVGLDVQPRDHEPNCNSQNRSERPHQQVQCVPPDDRVALLFQEDRNHQEEKA